MVVVVLPRANMPLLWIVQLSFDVIAAFMLMLASTLVAAAAEDEAADINISMKI